MKITVEFESEEEFKERIKNPRGAKGGEPVTQQAGQAVTQQAPAPLQPPVQQQPAAFNPSSAPAFQQPAFVAPATDPIVGRIITRIDGAIASGQPADAVLTWFRGQCGSEAASATMDQIKQVFLPKLAMPTLENIARLMNA